MAVQSLQVLLVEDQEANIDAWKDKAASHNADAEVKGFRVETLFAQSAARAQQLLDEHKFDAVVVDLRLNPDEGKEGIPNDDGNALMKHVAAMHPVAMAVYSGQRQEADITEFPQVETFDRGNGLVPVFDWLAKQLVMVMQLRRTRQAIERETARIFFRSIWPRWTHWTKSADGAELGDTLARHVVAHVHDSMLYSGGEIAHPEETYFVPPLKDRLDTGDLVRLADDLWIVVSPRCDLANAGKVPTVLIAHCKDIAADWVSKPKEKASMVQHGKAPKWHFLPPILDGSGKELGPWYVEFSHLRAVPAADVAKDLTANRFASLAPQFVPSLVERFGAYFSRIGTPNLSSD